ncbi:MAG: hypothetical protein HC895_24670 [Leptolyngbyaceae cyanobacterium SM1_3_5]|nr:hypothetical protein [Leptolyngbyaceae cyanobacterium SM1_3_5]
MLSTLIWAPIVGVGLICLPQLPPSRTRSISLVIASFTLLWTIAIVLQFDPSSPPLQLCESIPWIAQLGLSYELGVDGLSLPLIAICSLLTWVSIYSTDVNINRPRLYFALMLLLQSAVAGAFLSQNLLLFFFFYELELIPLYLLIAIWGGAKRGYAATNS